MPDRIADIWGPRTPHARDTAWPVRVDSHTPHGEAGVSGARVVAAALSVAVTATLLTLLRSEHAPAGATTLIVSLGFITAPLDLVWMASSVVLLTAASVLLNRATGVRQPL